MPPDDLDTMSLLDILVVSYLFWGFYLGMRRGLVAEAARIVAILIVLGFIKGFGLFSVVRQGISSLMDALYQPTGIGLSLLVVMGAVLIVWRVKKRLRMGRDKSKPMWESGWKGGIAGLLRVLLLSGIALTAIRLLLPDLVTQKMFEHSWAERVLDLMSGAWRRGQ